ncbi:MAG: MerR family transcriptional regulator [Chloroflexi bacterium]|nr:MerR family transcriptional regulator [Chloroflexota bacterium]
MYETWGFLPPIPRTASGYRMYTPLHLEQMRLARMALHGGWPGRNIRQSALALVRQAASGDLSAALALAHHHLSLVRAERAQAESAADFLQRWGQSRSERASPGTTTIGKTAALLDLTIDTLRSWERNGLVKPARDLHNGYRRYGAAEVGRLRVIRLLYRSGYSTMAILRTLLTLDQDQGTNADLRAALDTPRPDEDILTAADHWLTTLTEQEQRALQLVRQIERMIALPADPYVTKPSISPPGL